MYQCLAGFLVLHFWSPKLWFLCCHALLKGHGVAVVPVLDLGAGTAIGILADFDAEA